MHPSTKTLVCLSLIGGTLVGLTPDVKAQVTVTGGDFSGNAGFFMPGMGTDIKLLDATVKTLNLESSIGNTSTAIFTPTAARFNNDGADTASVDAGDTGILRGLLTGVAYDSNAFPVIFTNVGTQLDFSVTDFTVQKSLNGGTLISPIETGTAPLVFINKAVTVAAESATAFKATPGDLDVGSLSASLTDGSINLPATYAFLSSSDGGSGSSDQILNRRVKFQFKGKSVLPDTGTDLDTSDDEIRFVGDANEKLQIQTIGTQASSEFKIEAKKNENAVVDVTLGGPFSKIKGDSTGIDVASALDYDIKGEAEGSFSALILTNGIASSEFDGLARRDVDFKFEQGGSKFEGRSDGTVKFLAAVGTAAIAEQNSGDSTYGFVGCSSTCADSVSSTSEISAININVLTIDDLLSDLDDQPDSTVADSGDQNDLTQEEYEALDAQLEAVNVDIDIDIDIKVVTLGHERYYVAYPKEYKGKYKGTGKYKGKKYGRDNVICFRQVGPGSAVFPGLLSLVQIDFDDIPVDIIAGLPEIADADTTVEDTTDDFDDDSDDSDDGSDDDSDDADDSDDDADDSDDDSDDADDSDDDADDSDDDADDSDDSDDDSDDDADDADDSDDSDDDSDDSDDDADDSEEIIIVPGLNEIPAESDDASE